MYFFFQAEDGIRDRNVTGVQTCALPISDDHLYSLSSSLMVKEDYDFVFVHPMGIDDAGHKFGAGSKEYSGAVIQNDKLLSTYIRSEERRVGKECRCGSG